MRQDFRKALSVLSAFALASFAANALATAQRTFVASTGVDTNACSITAPCRGFAAAVAKTAADGEVIVLDSAGYGPVTLTTSISLIAPPGVYAGITVFSGDGITINAPGSVVVLRGLTINGQGGTTGIRAQAVSRVRIENCVISNMLGAGIVQDIGVGLMFVLDTIVRDNDGGISVASGGLVLDHVRSERNTFDGLSMIPLSGLIDAAIFDSVFAFNHRHGINVETSLPGNHPSVVVDRSILADNFGDGITFDGSNTSFTGAVRRSTIHRNGNNGVHASGSAAAQSTVTITDNSIINNSVGVNAENFAVVFASTNDVIGGGGTGFQQATGASFLSYRNNSGSVSNSGTISTGIGF